MIDYIVGGEFMSVTSNKGATPYVNTLNPITGMVAYDGPSQSMKIFDGNNWVTVGGGSATINLSPNAISILKWAERKMQEEYERQTLAETNPAIKDLVNQIKEKENQIEMVMTLMKSTGTEGQELMGS